MHQREEIPQQTEQHTLERRKNEHGNVIAGEQSLACLLYTSLGIVDTNGAAAQLTAVEDNVVRLGTNLGRCLLYTSHLRLHLFRRPRRLQHGYRCCNRNR